METRPEPNAPTEAGNNLENVKVESSESNNSVSQLQRDLGLEPTTIVLAKVKGYRAWPAMILDEAILPENIQQMKPKSLKLAKKPSAPVIIVPVRFFSDDTYIWLKSCDLKKLSAADIEAFLAKKATSKTLVAAYKLAQNPPDMEEFNRWGSAGPPDPDALPDSPPKKKLKLSLKLKKPPLKNSPVKKTVKNTPVEEESEEFDDDDDSQSGYDSDWGLDGTDYDFAAGDYIFDDEQQQEEFAQNFPRAEDLAANLEFFQKKFAQLHRNISPALLSGDIDEKHLLAQLRSVQSLLSKADTPLVAFLKSPLYRVLLLTAHKPVEVFPNTAVREAIAKTLGQLDLQVCEVKLEDLDPETPAETPGPEAEKDENEKDNEKENDETEAIETKEETIIPKTESEETMNSEAKKIDSEKPQTTPLAFTETVENTA